MDEKSVAFFNDAIWMFAEHQVNDKRESSSSNVNVGEILVGIRYVLNVYINAIKRQRYPHITYRYADPKSEANARLANQQARNLFNEHNFEGALIEANKGIASAPWTSEVFVEAYGIRSFVLQCLNHFRESMMDENRALPGNCPCELKHELKCRKKVREVVEGSVLKTEAKKLKDLRKIDEKMDAEWRALCKFHPPNPLLPNSSSKIKLMPLKPETEEKWGSNLRAVEDIEPGEILMVHENYAMAPFPETRFTHCAHCLVKCDNLIPCPSCTQTMYCCKTCRDTAYVLYHRTECQMMKIYTPRADEMLAIRAFLRGTEQGKALPKLKAYLQQRDIFGPRSYTFEQIFVGDYIELMRSTEPLLSSTGTHISAILPIIAELILTLRELSFFPQSGDQITDELSEMEFFAAQLLINNLMAVKASSKMMLSGEITRRENDVIELELPGVCLTPVLKLINYSCNTNTHIIIRNRQCVFYALRRIKSGEPIFFAREIFFVQYSKEERSRISSQLSRTCLCEACCNNWPMYVELRQQPIRFLKDDGGKKELYNTLVRKLLANVEERNAFRKRSRNEILRLIIDHLKWMQDNTDTKPSSDFLSSQYMLRRAMKTFYSDHHDNNVDNIIFHWLSTLTQITHIRAMLPLDSDQKSTQ